MGDVYVVGVGMTPFGKSLDRSVKDLPREAVLAALADAGIGRDRIDAAFFANAAQPVLDGQFMIGGEIALRGCGFSGIPIVNVENACASASTAFHLAVGQLKAGMAEVVLAVGAEKMYDADKARSFAIFDGAWDVHEVAASTEALLALGDGVLPPPGRPEGSSPRSVFMDI